MNAKEMDRDDRLEASGESLNTAGLTRSEIVGRRFRLRVVGPEPTARVVFVSAECGMGKTWLAHDVIASLEKQGYATRYVSLAGLESSRACRKVMLIARKVRARAREAEALQVVVFDDVPPIEECDLGKVRRALERMVAAGAFVLVCMRPEAEALMEEMGSCAHIVASELLDMYRIDFDGHRPPSMTPHRHIAALLFGGANAEPSAEAQKGAWRKAVGTLACGLLRDTLPLEDQRLRLAMMLLGSGSFDELHPVIPKVDAEMLEWLSRDTPFFGIDHVHDSFSCVGFVGRSDFEECAESLRDACRRLPETVANAARVLAARGDFARLALVCGFCDEQSAARIVCTWGVELVCEGKVDLVSRMVQQHDVLGLDPTPELRLAAQAVYVVGDYGAAGPARQDEGGADGEETFELVKKRRMVDLLIMCRNLDRCAPSGKVSMRRDDNETSRALVRHIKARRLILSGRVAEAYALLVNDPLRLSPDTLVSAWLCDDFDIAQALIGETPRNEELRSSERARATMAQTGVERLVRYQSMIEPLMAVLVGRERQLEGAEEVVARASRVGDSGIQALLLLGLAVVDNREKAYARAHVRAVQAAELLTGTNGRHLLLVARFVDALAAMGLGDNNGLVALARRTTPSTVRDLASYMVCQEAEEADSIELSALTRSACSEDILWMLNMLCGDFEGASAAFREVIPRSWLAMSRRSVRRRQATVNHAAHQEGEQASREVMLAVSEEQVALKPVGEHEKPICISVLGEFAMTVEGELIPSTTLAQRRARSFVTFLAMRRGHTMRRFELVECVWPEADFDAGRQKIYEAASTVRRIIARKTNGRKIDPFVGSKSDGVVGLNTALVTCDVDQFEKLAHTALAADDDGRIVDLAIQATALYRGDLCETPFDATGTAEQRRGELRNLFVDVSVAGAMAAMRDDLLPLAVRMAWAAYEASSMREDVVLVLVEALKMSGRVLDARNVYLSYARSLLEQTGEPPSASLRAAIAKIIPSSGSGRARKGGGPKKKRALVYSG